MDWKDISLKQYLDIRDIQKTSSNPANSLIEYFFDVHDAESSLPATEYLAKLRELGFIGKERPSVKVKGEYTLNSRVYVLQAIPTALSTAQYIDFDNYNRTGDVAGLLSVVLIPKTAKHYNDGYDIEQAKADILTMSVIDVDAVNAFFLKLLKRYIKIFRRCLSKLSRTEGMEQTAPMLETLTKAAGELCRMS